MGRLIALIMTILAIATVSLPRIAWAAGYSAQNLGGSTYLTWSFLNIDAPEFSDDQAEPVLVGYACITEDTLGAMVRTGRINRYAIYAKPYSNFNALEPLQGVVVEPGDEGFIATESTPIAVEQLWRRAQLTPSGTWFLNNVQPESVGLACVNGGIAGALQQLERIHSVSIQR